jgi:hypothetical protein
VEGVAAQAGDLLDSLRIIRGGYKRWPSTWPDAGSGAPWSSAGPRSVRNWTRWPHQEDASELRFQAETVIIGMGLRADHSLAEALADQPDVYTIGDCVEPREAMDAVWEGFEVGRTV